MAHKTSPRRSRHLRKFAGPAATPPRAHASKVRVRGLLGNRLALGQPVTTGRVRTRRYSRFGLENDPSSSLITMRVLAWRIPATNCRNARSTTATRKPGAELASKGAGSSRVPYIAAAVIITSKSRPAQDPAEYCCRQQHRSRHCFPSRLVSTRTAVAPGFHARQRKFAIAPPVLWVQRLLPTWAASSFLFSRCVFCVELKKNLFRSYPWYPGS